MKRSLAGAAAILVIGLAGYLMLAPVPVEPVAWNAPQDAGYAGAYAANRKLANLSRIELDGAVGPEHVAMGPSGWLYAAVAGGTILRMRPDGSSREVWAQTGGRVLGFDFDAGGRLIAADAMRGLLAIDAAAPHHVNLLADQVAPGDPVRFADAVVVAPNGDIYFTDASRLAPASHGGTFEASVLDYLEHTPSGRVLAYRPATGKVELVAGGLSFANGLALSSDGRTLFVAETGAYRVWALDPAARKLDLARGPVPGARVLLDNLPGFPDNLMRGQDGRIWPGFAKPRSHTADSMSAKPFLRKVAMRLPHALWPVPPAYGHVIAFTEDGRIVADLQDPDGQYPETTGVLETADRLYIQSLHAGWLGWLPKSRVPL